MLLVSPHVQTVQNMYGKGEKRVLKAKLGAAEVDPHFKKMRICGVQKNKHGRNFQNIASKMNHRWLINYEKPLINFGTDILKIVAMLVFLDTSYFC